MAKWYMRKQLKDLKLIGVEHSNLRQGILYCLEIMKVKPDNGVVNDLIKLREAQLGTALKDSMVDEIQKLKSLCN